MNVTTSREIRLRSRPDGMPGVDAFELAETRLEPLRDGQILVRNSWMSVDPYMRFQMMEQNHYQGWQIGQVIDGGAIGRVVESRSPEWKVGDVVSSLRGWREAYVATVQPSGAPPQDRVGLQKLDTMGLPMRDFLGGLGIPGISAYAGMIRIGALKEKESVLISGAAGAVGIVACQIAKAMNCRVVGIAGSDEKCAWLRETAGVDETINYRNVKSLNSAVRAAAPDGIDLFFDNVGGDALVAALGSMRHFGRLVICGTISQYNVRGKTVGPYNLNLVVPKALRLEGFEIADHLDLRPQFLQDMARWMKAGKMKFHNTVLEGIENAPGALVGLFKGDNLGKMLVRIGPDD